MVAIDRDGAVRRSTVPAAELASSMVGGYFKASLPQVTPATRQVVVAFDRPSHRMTLERAYLAPDDGPGGTYHILALLPLAALAGMLAMPLIFNAAFYRILRERFVLWHSAMTLSLLLTIVVSSGLAVAMFDPPAMTLSWMATLVFGAAIASGLMFTHSFVEPGYMHPLLRRVLPYAAIAALSLSTLHAAFPFVARPVQSTLYTAAFAPILAIFILSVADALRRGSRAAKFQAIGYAPMVGVGLVRLTTGVIPSLESADAMMLFYIGCVWEVLFTTLGVADRFMTIKHDRDGAQTKADLLESLSELDPLTGLLNRRALDRHFPHLRNDGFRMLAVVDVDHFKAINDRHGHAVGDEVLKAVANALRAGPDVHAYRIGGEEFLLLLRGDDAGAQAERRRQAIPAIVADAVPGVHLPVTASMGIAGMSKDAADEDLATLYRRADKLLYEAKSAGRNRSRAILGRPSDRATAPIDRRPISPEPLSRPSRAALGQFRHHPQG